MSRLCNVDVETIKINKLSVTQNFTSEFNVTVVLKDTTSIIVSPDGQVYFNIIGNNGMAKGGSGDVLSGIIGSLMSQGLSLINSSVLGVYLHALSGDLSSEKFGEHSMLPSDIVNNLPKAILKLKSKE